MIEKLIIDGANFIWGTPLLVLLLGGGIFFTIYSRFLPFRYFGHAIKVLRGKYDDHDDPGQISHFQALSGHLAATIGMGNISGVAVAIAAGGPGAIFWMWVSAFFGMATKYFTCTLSIMYRGKGEDGQMIGGPMYFIKEGLGPKWIGLAIFFSIVGALGSTPIFQANQMIAAINDIAILPNGGSKEENLLLNLSIGITIAILTSLVILGGIKRIGLVAAKLVPTMVILYVGGVLMILLLNYPQVLPSLQLIITDAFTAKAAMGGAVGALIVVGARRAAFSNEAGIGTAPMMHGDAKTSEPVREGLVAMLGPAIDTLLICTMTGLCILVTDVWLIDDANGITLTARAFDKSLPVIGPIILLLSVLVFAFTTIVGLSYYGRKCVSFLIGSKYGWYFNYWYIGLILVGSVTSLQVVVSFIDIAYGLMAFPTVIAAILLSPKVYAETRRYFKQNWD